MGKYLRKVSHAELVMIELARSRNAVRIGRLRVLGLTRLKLRLFIPGRINNVFIWFQTPPGLACGFTPPLNLVDKASIAW